MILRELALINSSRSLGSAYGHSRITYRTKMVCRAPRPSCAGSASSCLSRDPYKIFANYTSKLEESETLVSGNVNWISASNEEGELFKFRTEKITKVAKKGTKEKEVDVDDLIRKMMKGFE